MVEGHALLDISVYEDLLCPWCYVAQSRLGPLKEELGQWAVWRMRPFPLWLPKGPLSWAEREDAMQQVRRARLEPEGEGLSSELWEFNPPRSSLPPLMALEAARLQGEAPMRVLRAALQQASLFQGVDVARHDVLLELASRQGLQMDRFEAALRSADLRRLIRQGQEMARARGVHSAPTLVINGRWMISGLRELTEYRELFLSRLKLIAAAPLHLQARRIH